MEFISSSEYDKTYKGDGQKDLHDFLLSEANQMRELWYCIPIGSTDLCVCVCVCMCICRDVCEDGYQNVNSGGLRITGFQVIFSSLYFNVFEFFIRNLFSYNSVQYYFHTCIRNKKKI